jgi:hypothetical protein
MDPTLDGKEASSIATIPLTRCRFLRELIPKISLFNKVISNRISQYFVLFTEHSINL